MTGGFGPQAPWMAPQSEQSPGLLPLQAPANPLRRARATVLAHPRYGCRAGTLAARALYQKPTTSTAITSNCASTVCTVG